MELSTLVGKNPDSSDGEVLLRLLLESQSWAHRRVDSLRMSADGRTRRHVSVDVTVPEDAQIQGSKGRIVVPLAVLNKGTKTRLDARFEGKSLPILGRKDNSKLAVEMLCSAILNLKNFSPSDESRAVEVISSVVHCNEQARVEELSKYKIWAASEQIEVPQELDLLIRLLAGNYLFMVEVDESMVGVRCTLKYAFDQDVQARSPEHFIEADFSQLVPDYGFSASQHFELEVPSSLTIVSLDFVEFDFAGSSTKIDHLELRSRSEPPFIAHSVLEPGHRFYNGLVIARLTPAKAGLLSFTKSALVFTSFLVLIATLVRIFSDVVLAKAAVIPSPSASILLIGPALLLSWISRQVEHPYEGHLLKPLRWILYLCTTVLVLMAILAAIPVAQPVWHGAWILVFGSVLAAWFVFAWYFLGETIKGHVSRIRWNSNREVDHG